MSVSLEEAQDFTNKESYGLSILGLGNKLLINASLRVFSCCYGRSHSGALAVCFNREHAQCGWAGGGGGAGAGTCLHGKRISIMELGD